MPHAQLGSDLYHHECFSTCRTVRKLLYDYGYSCLAVVSRKIKSTATWFEDSIHIGRLMVI